MASNKITQLSVLNIYQANKWAKLGGEELDFVIEKIKEYGEIAIEFIYDIKCEQGTSSRTTMSFKVSYTDFDRYKDITDESNSHSQFQREGIENFLDQLNVFHSELVANVPSKDDILDNYVVSRSSESAFSSRELGSISTPVDNKKGFFSRLLTPKPSNKKTPTSTSDAKARVHEHSDETFKYLYEQIKTLLPFCAEYKCETFTATLRKNPALAQKLINKKIGRSQFKLELEQVLEGVQKDNR